MPFKLVLTTALLLTLISCEKVELSQINQNWSLEAIEIDGKASFECSQMLREKEVSLVIEPEEDHFRFGGQSFVNAYFGSFSILKYNRSSGKLNVKGVGSTKKLGPPALQACEDYYFKMLDAADSFALSANGELHLLGQKEIDGKPSKIELIFHK
ncbi:META domain-containing protein [Marinilongibacter aquaticus]|uniref:META domain-containing protein n=1 Tax=Marinilongibacter aquaticus TaxID=2975157 RepID=UPI0021BDA30A|nr:META domain-containing protein [Marinilongibacter aquaticus]UBM57877.1 META domain-containing protein [Marinilongibacter aquaticus]